LKTARPAKIPDAAEKAPGPAAAGADGQPHTGDECAILDHPDSPSQLYELHTPPRKIGQAAHDNGVKSLLLNHLAPDVQGREAAVRKSIRASYAGPLAFASDKLRVPIAQ
jgi:hypothetical protein